MCVSLFLLFVVLLGPLGDEVLVFEPLRWDVDLSSAAEDARLGVLGTEFECLEWALDELLEDLKILKIEENHEPSDFVFGAMASSSVFE